MCERNVGLVQVDAAPSRDPAGERRCRGSTDCLGLQTRLAYTRMREGPDLPAGVGLDVDVRVAIDFVRWSLFGIAAA